MLAEAETLRDDGNALCKYETDYSKGDLIIVVTQLIGRGGD